MQRLLNFLRLPPKDKMLFFEAVFFLFLSKFILSLLPLKKCVKFIGTKQQARTAKKEELLPLKTALYRANQLALWKNICLVQSFAGKLMLRRRQIASKLYLGVDISTEKEMKAHAWLTSNLIEIVPKNGNYTTLYHLE